MALSIIRLDHLYVTVSDLARAESFYDPVMQALGFRKGTRPIAGEPHLHYFNQVMQYTIRPARSGSVADPYHVGSVHHVCFQVQDEAAVNEAYALLCSLGASPSMPRLYSDYRPDYYATFFSDPDGIRLEIVCDTLGRRLVRERWDELEGFVDPVSRLLANDAKQASHTAAAAAPAAISCGNLFDESVPPSTGEIFEALATLRGTRIERIVSSASPAGEPYDQAEDEWVVLLRGEARLELAGQAVELRAGDHVLLKAHTKHRVLSTSDGALWLAVHGAPD